MVQTTATDIGSADAAVFDADTIAEGGIGWDRTNKLLRIGDGTTPGGRKIGGGVEARDLVATGSAVVTSNAAGGTKYAVTVPAKFDLANDGALVDFVVPETSLGPISLSIGTVPERGVSMVVAQKFRGGWTVRVSRNDGGVKWNLVSQTPQGSDVATSELLIPEVTATVISNNAAGTEYRIVEPAGFNFVQQGAKFRFVFPETNVSISNAFISIYRNGAQVQASLIEMVIGQKLQKGWRGEFINNVNNARITLDRQTPDAFGLFPLIADLGQVDDDPAVAHTATNWRFKSRNPVIIGGVSRFSFFAPMNNSGALDVTIDGSTFRLRKAVGNDLSANDIKFKELVTVSYPGGDQNSLFVLATGLPQTTAPEGATDAGIPIPVDSPVFSQTDFPAAATIVKTGTSLKITRPIADTDNRRLASPNARDRCRVQASWVEWIVMHGATGSMPAPKTPLVLIDGVATGAVVSTVGTAGNLTVRTIRVSPGISAAHDVELIWPYEGPMEIIGRRASTDLIVGTIAARPANKLVMGGDSLTQGFEVTSMADQWAYLLARDIGYRAINQGYGGRILVSADGTVYGGEAGTITTMFIMANDVTQQTPLATITSRLNAFFTAFFGAHPTGNAAKLLMISQPWMEAGDGGVPTTIPGSQYRTTMQNAVAAAVGTYANLRYKSGLDLSNGPGTTFDGTHFTSATSRDQVYPRLKTTLQSLGWVP